MVHLTRGEGKTVAMGRWVCSCIRVEKVWVGWGGDKRGGVYLTAEWSVGGKRGQRCVMRS